MHEEFSQHGPPEHFSFSCCLPVRQLVCNCLLYEMTPAIMVEHFLESWRSIAQGRSLVNGVDKCGWQVSICVACRRSAVKHRTLYQSVNVMMYVVHWMHLGFIVNKI